MRNGFRPNGTVEYFHLNSSRPSGTEFIFARNPQLKLRAIVGRRCATTTRARGAGIAEDLRRAFAQNWQ